MKKALAKRERPRDLQLFILLGDFNVSNQKVSNWTRSTRCHSLANYNSVGACVKS